MVAYRKVLYTHIKKPYTKLLSSLQVCLEVYYPMYYPLDRMEHAFSSVPSRIRFGLRES